MHLIVDDARQQVFTRCIDNFIGGNGQVWADLSDKAIFYKNIRLKNLPFVYDKRIFYENCFHEGEDKEKWRFFESEFHLNSGQFYQSIVNLKRPFNPSILKTVP